MKRVLSALWSAWQQNYWRRRTVGRRRAGLMALQPLEVRVMLSGEFTDLGAMGITAVNASSVAWGDVDNDGDLDALVAGAEGTYHVRTTKVYRNNGNSTFTDLGVPLIGVYNGSVAWGDYDTDGDLDILLTGSASRYNLISKVYRNNGDSTFTDINAGLAGVDRGSAAWGDADNDGDLDILLTGFSNSGRIAKVCRNNGDETFTDLNAGLTGVMFSSVAWGDTDRDGDLDILLTGSSFLTGGFATIYRNNGDNSFTDLNVGLTGVEYSSVALGDADNDGDLDILLAGFDGGNQIATVYRNNGNNTFTDVNAGLAGVHRASVGWGDVDNDGDLDILVTGRGGTGGGTTNVYRNNANSTFTEINAGLSSVELGSAAWGDVDRDGDLDILLTGFNTATNAAIAKVYRNNIATANTVPAPPTGLTATAASATSLTFSWMSASDTQTPAAGLSYNLRVGTTPGGSDVFSTMASSTSGIRRLPHAGPIQGTSYTLEGLVQGTAYYWSVQAIDTAFDGGACAAEQTAMTPPSGRPTIGGAVANQPVNDNATIKPFAALTVIDSDAQDLFARVTILNGVVRGDFTTASTVGWTRTVVGNDIRYHRYYTPQANVGAVVQAAIRAFLFIPRTDAIKPNTTEKVALIVYVTDGTTWATDNTTSLVTTSVNNVPTLSGAIANQAMNDSQTRAVFSAVILTDSDTQDMFIRVTIVNGANRGDFTAASTTGWTRTVNGANIVYHRYFPPMTNIGVPLQAAIRALVFQPRSNVPIGTTETTSFVQFVNDDFANITNSTTSVITTGVAPRLQPMVDHPPAILEADLARIIVPSLKRAAANPLARLLRKSR